MESKLEPDLSSDFYPTAFEGIAFTHTVQMGGLVDIGEKVCLCCISETIRCRKLKLDIDLTLS